MTSPFPPPGEAQPPTVWTPPPPGGPPPPQPGPPGAGPGGGGRSNGLLIGLLVGGLALLLFLGGVGFAAWALVGSDDDGGEDAAPATTTTTAEEGDELDPAPQGEGAIVPTGDDELDATLDEISAFVEESRGLEFEEPVQVELLDDEEFEARLLEDAEEDEEELQDTEDLFRALGFLPADLDLGEALDQFLGVGVLGFYDPETGELVVRGGEVTPFRQTVIAHELVHALEDQHFDLDRPEYYEEQRDDELATGFDHLTEGSASVFEEEYRDSLSDDEQDDADEEEASYGEDLSFDLPPLVLEFLTSPYTLGPELVEAILDEGGQEALDAAFEEPPTTSEQVLFPELFVAGEEGIPVEAPEADGEAFDEGAFGAQALFLMLYDAVGPEAASQAIAGWGGDSYVAWRDGDSTCVRAAFVGDTEEDTQEIATALSAYAEEHSDASVEVADGQVLLEACG